MSSGGTPSPSSSDEQREQQLQQNLATVDGSFIARDGSSPINTRARELNFPLLANAQNINESRLLQSQDIDPNQISNNEHHASRISGEVDKIEIERAHNNNDHSNLHHHIYIMHMMMTVQPVAVVTVDSC